MYHLISMKMPVYSSICVKAADAKSAIDGVIAYFQTEEGKTAIAERLMEEFNIGNIYFIKKGEGVEFTYSGDYDQFGDSFCDLDLTKGR